MKKLDYFLICSFIVLLLTACSSSLKTPQSPTGDSHHLANIATIENVGDDVFLRYDQKITPQMTTVESPPQIIVDLPDSKAGDSLHKDIPLQSKFIKNITYESPENSSSLVRVTIHLTQAVQASLEQSETAKQITVHLAGSSVGATLHPFKVVIDAGHGGKDPGAEGVNGKNEAELNLSIALKVRDLLVDEPSIELYLTRTEDTFLSLDDRVNMANQLNADVFLSIHANVDKDSKIGGTETFINRESSSTFAETIQKYVQQATNFRDRHVAYDNYRVIKNTTMPAALVEVGFLSNEAEYKALFKNINQKKIAEAISAGIKAYLGIE